MTAAGVGAGGNMFGADVTGPCPFALWPCGCCDKAGAPFDTVPLAAKAVFDDAGVVIECFVAVLTDFWVAAVGCLVVGGFGVGAFAFTV